MLHRETRMVEALQQDGHLAPGIEFPSATSDRSFHIADGTLEGLKWCAAVLMVVDHVNKFLFAHQYVAVYDLGRLSMPIFGFVLAYHLSRPQAFVRGTHVRLMQRLFLYGVLATPMFVALVGWWPLNILFTLLVFVAMVYCVERGGVDYTVAAIGLFVIAGALVEFWWFALASCLTAWVYCRRPTPARLVLWGCATLSLSVVNQNLWALVACPLLFWAQCVTGPIPRVRWAFYALYPLHLAVILLAKVIWW